MASNNPGCCSRTGCFGRRFGDPDIVFAYNTPAFVKVRDKRLGITYLCLQVIIFVYILVYQVIFQQKYRILGTVFGSARLQIFGPTPDVRMPEGQVPYCLGSASQPPLPGYDYPTNSTYTWNGVLPATPQGSCEYQDAVLAIRDVFLPGGSFVPTRTMLTPQTVVPQPACVTLGSPSCTWNTTPGLPYATPLLTYVADPELFTVYIDHSFSSTVGIAASGNSLSGALLDQDGNRVNPCNVYIRRGLACPDIINIGVPNKNDIVPLAALLDAAGILSLDAMGKGASGPGIANNLLRYSGLILYVQITYFNFYSPTPPSKVGTKVLDENHVQYTYSVLAASNTQFKGQTYITSDSSYPPQNRTYIDSHGVRLNIVQSGAIGVFDVMTTLIQLTTALGLLAVASVIVDFVMLNLCATRALLRQYKSRLTGDTTELPKELLSKSFLKQLEDDPYALNPAFPAIVEQALRERGALRTVRHVNPLAASSEIALSPLGTSRTPRATGSDSAEDAPRSEPPAAVASSWK